MWCSHSVKLIFTIFFHVQITWFHLSHMGFSHLTNLIFMCYFSPERGEFVLWFCSIVKLVFMLFVHTLGMRLHFVQTWFFLSLTWLMWFSRVVCLGFFLQVAHMWFIFLSWFIFDLIFSHNLFGFSIDCSHVGRTISFLTDFSEEIWFSRYFFHKQVGFFFLLFNFLRLLNLFSEFFFRAQVTWFHFVQMGFFSCD